MQLFRALGPRIPELVLMPASEVVALARAASTDIAQINSAIDAVAASTNLSAVLGSGACGDTKTVESSLSGKRQHRRRTAITTRRAVQVLTLYWLRLKEVVIMGWLSIFQAHRDHVVRGYFSLGDHEQVVHVSSTSAFRIYMWARNVETSQGGVQVLTPPSQFRGSGASGPQDGLVMDVPAQTGRDLGCIGAQAGETLDISNAFGTRVTVFLTVVTARGATVTMTWS